MRKFALHVKSVSLIAILKTFVPHLLSAADCIELPEPQWTYTIPDNTTTEDFYKNYYSLGKNISLS
ncbi:hypothetical protein [Paenibacillus sp. NPDC058177]|uniref:hypothetical protein n=1 Tax=Paenibacillus sp. NPDC058177 TaxID=3346369 RepID=UPI0036D8DA90